ncbi:MAG TPA: response regulator [Desulfohalobiaceae bacterium]|nr:response regulator [Desulfohalobiaceae bacterium]
MKTLIVEDEFSSRKILEKFLGKYGKYEVAVNGQEAIDSFQMAWEEKEPYDLVVLDIMMPNVDGQEALKQIRAYEKDKGVVGFGEVKVIMVTALDDPKNVVEAFYEGGANSYLVKPIDNEQLNQELKNLGLI